MKYPVYNLEGNKTGEIELSGSVFNEKVNNDLLHQVITSQQANKRQTLSDTKDRSEVRGGGKRPWRQKGTGRARHSSIRSPIWRGGGVTFGPRANAVFRKKINRAVMKQALKMVLSTKVEDSQLVIFEDMKLDQAKTKIAAGIVSTAQQIGKDSKGSGQSMLVLTDGKNQIVERSFRNIPEVRTMEMRNINPLVLLEYNLVLADRKSIASLESSFGK